MHQIRSLCVYCGSSKSPKESYAKAAEKMGQLLAENGIRLVYGGGDVGLMGIVAQACIKNGGYAIGVMTEFLMRYEGLPDDLSELHVVQSMHERKQKMFELSDGFIILPGGLGTLDETFEVLTWRQVGLHGKSVVFVDVDGYWAPLLDTLLPHMIREGFVRSADENLLGRVKSVEEVIPAFQKTPYANTDFVSKWG